MGSFLAFSHSRKKSISEISDDLNLVIKDFTYKNPYASSFIEGFSRRHRVSVEAVQKQMLIYLEGSYNYQKSRFQKNVFISKVSLYILKEIAFLILCLLRSKTTKSKRKFKVVLDLVESKNELDRFENILKHFPKESIGVVSRALSRIESEYEIFDQANYRNYEKSVLATSLLREFFVVIPQLFILSLRSKVNFFAFNLSFLNQVFYYRSIVKKMDVCFLGQDRHYNPGAIKKYILNYEANAKVFSIQKNIYQTGRNGFNYFFDIMFSIGNKTLGDFSRYNGEIGEILPVGSMYMDSLFWKKKEQLERSEKYDILFVGINTAQAMFYLDCYESFKEDYYKSFEWLARFKRRFPNYKVGVKHHASLRVKDEREERILSDSGIIAVDKRLSSYSLCYNAGSVVTFGSTMGFEFVGHKKPVVFIDPGHNCAFFPLNSSFCRSIRASSYDEFESMLISSLEKGLDDKIEPRDFCFNSESTSLKIAQRLKESM